VRDEISSTGDGSDLLVVDVEEHYHNITLKVLHAFKWFLQVSNENVFLFIFTSHCSSFYVHICITYDFA